MKQCRNLSTKLSWDIGNQLNMESNNKFLTGKFTFNSYFLFLIHSCSLITFNSHYEADNSIKSAVCKYDNRSVFRTVITGKTKPRSI